MRSGRRRKQWGIRRSARSQSRSSCLSSPLPCSASYLTIHVNFRKRNDSVFLLDPSPIIGNEKKNVQQSRFSLCQEINISFGASSLLLVLGIQLRPHLFYSLHFSIDHNPPLRKQEKAGSTKKSFFLNFFLAAQKYLKRNEHCNISHGIKQTDIYLRSRHFLPASSFFGGQY